MLESNSFDKFPTWASQQNLLENRISFDKLPPQASQEHFHGNGKKLFPPRLVKKIYMKIEKSCDKFPAQASQEHVHCDKFQASQEQCCVCRQKIVGDCVVNNNTYYHPDCMKVFSSSSSSL